MTSELARTRLYQWHVDHGARMVEFGGWKMPVQYTSIVEEHVATRQAIGLFDISHMGRLRFDGAAAGRFLDSLVTRRVDDLKTGRIRYALMTNDEGGVLDDVLVYHLVDGHLNEDGGSFHLMVVNASNRLKIVDWIGRHITDDVQCTDQTLDTAMIAVQGPRALELTAAVIGFDPSQLKYYRGQIVPVPLNGGGTSGGRVQAVVSRTGYTGEDGCELIVPADQAESLWQQLVDRGGAMGALPAGLGARDTLRLEAAMPLYGHEIDETISPLQAGLDFAVDLENRQFPGRDALARIQDGPALPRRVGLECSGRRVPRDGYAITRDGEQVGVVTSGGFSPTLQKPIAMGYVAPAASDVGTQLSIDVRGRGEPARVVKLPFYQRG
ncbi:MAG: glycine cleavage system aminomethyltransferase GcvT [Planctomycetota bacterium]|nr:glycine cleavage system aminomethyltransferase GcvT [Planctomycetota bacterium]